MKGVLLTISGREHQVDAVSRLVLAAQIDAGHGGQIGHAAGSGSLHALGGHLDRRSVFPGYAERDHEPDNGTGGRNLQNERAFAPNGLGKFEQIDLFRVRDALTGILHDVRFLMSVQIYRLFFRIETASGIFIRRKKTDYVVLLLTLSALNNTSLWSK